MSPEEEIKRIQIGKDVKLSVFADYMILYIRDPKKNPSRNNRETIKKIEQYGIIQNQLAEINNFLCTNNKHRKGNHGHTSIHSSSKKITYLRINLAKEGKDVYNKNFKPPKKEKDFRQWKDIPYSQSGIVNTVKTIV